VSGSVNYGTGEQPDFWKLCGNGVDPDTARRSFLNVKGKDTAHKGGGKADWKVDPQTVTF